MGAGPRHSCRGGDTIPVVSLIFTVPGHTIASYAPDRDVKVTALIAKGRSFKVKVGDRNGSTLTEDALLDGANLSTAILLNTHTSLFFDNESGSQRVGFLCAEEA